MRPGSAPPAPTAAPLHVRIRCEICGTFSVLYEPKFAGQDVEIVCRGCETPLTALVEPQ